MWTDSQIGIEASRVCCLQYHLNLPSQKGYCVFVAFEPANRFSRGARSLSHSPIKALFQDCQVVSVPKLGQELGLKWVLIDRSTPAGPELHNDHAQAPCSVRMPAIG